MSDRRRLLINGLIMSSAFAGLEGCVIASINLSAALFSPDLASDTNAVLFGCFSIGTLFAPTIVRLTGLKPAMVGSMGFYMLYLLPFIWAERISLFAGAAIGGLAGSVLWTAQGVYFTRNALAYAAADVSTAAGDSRAISVFAGLFAVIFQVVITLAKPFAAMMLTVWPDDRSLLFGSFLVVASACTGAMMLIRSFAGGAPTAVSEGSSAIPSTAAAAEGSQAGAGAGAGAGADTAARAGATNGRATAPQLRAARPAIPARARCPALVRVALDRQMLLVTVYHVAYGLSTAFFPSHVTVLTAQSLEGTCTDASSYASNATTAGAMVDAMMDATADAGVGCTSGAAAVGWMYTVAGLSSALIAAVFGWASHRFAAGRSAALVLGSVGFGVPCVLLLAAALGSAELMSSDGRLPLGQLLMSFICYGGGTAAWQGSAMALVGDLFKGAEDEHRAAFAHLKLTSGGASTVGFVLFRRMSLAASAAVTLTANVCALMAIGALAALEASGYVTGAAVAAPIVSTHVHAQASPAARASIMSEPQLELQEAERGTNVQIELSFGVRAER